MSTFSLPTLPWAEDALEPHTSAKTISFHYGKHHATYVNNLNNLIKGTELESASLNEIMAAAKKDGNAGLFNNAAQHYNHSFFWESMKPNGGGEPAADSKIGQKIIEDFGDYATFKAEFKTAAATHFGSGWAWLVEEDGKLKVVSTHDAETPVTTAGVTPILTCDVWEHAYYLDWQNRRPDFVDTFLDNLANWEFAEGNLTN